MITELEVQYTCSLNIITINVNKVYSTVKSGGACNKLIPPCHTFKMLQMTFSLRFASVVAYVEIS